MDPRRMKKWMWNKRPEGNAKEETKK
jgi:hypothetical protein